MCVLFGRIRLHFAAAYFRPCRRSRMRCPVVTRIPPSGMALSCPKWRDGLEVCCCVACGGHVQSVSQSVVRAQFVVCGSFLARRCPQLQCSTVQCSSVQYSTVQYSAVSDSAVQCCVSSGLRLWVFAGRLKMVASGAAPISPALSQFLRMYVYVCVYVCVRCSVHRSLVASSCRVLAYSCWAVGLVLVALLLSACRSSLMARYAEGYGLTETSGISTTTNPTEYNVRTPFLCRLLWPRFVLVYVSCARFRVVCSTDTWVLRLVAAKSN